MNASILFIAFTLPLTFFRRTQTQTHTHTKQLCWKRPGPRSINWILVWVLFLFRFLDTIAVDQSVLVFSSPFFIQFRSDIAKTTKCSFKSQFHDVDASLEYHHFIQLYPPLKKENEKKNRRQQRATPTILIQGYIMRKLRSCHWTNLVFTEVKSEWSAICLPNQHYVKINCDFQVDEKKRWGEITHIVYATHE